MKGVSFDQYVATLTNLETTSDPTVRTDEEKTILQAADAIIALPAVTVETLATLVAEHPEYVPALAYAVRLSRERLKNALKHRFDTSNWASLAKQRPQELVMALDESYKLVRLIEKQRGLTYRFGDILVARSSGHTVAAGAARGRRIEDEVEKVARALNLNCVPRTSFIGRNNRRVGCDLAIPASEAQARIVIAAKGFNSTGSKLSDAVREVKEMAEFRLPGQYVFAVIDGIGWKNRKSDLRHIYELWTNNMIDGIYTLAMMPQLQKDLRAAAKRLDLL